MTSLHLRRKLNQMVDRLVVRADECNSTVQATKEIILQLVNCMKKVDPLFNAIYSQTVYIGSYYENLKISQPDEFDINLQLSLPFQENQYQVLHSGLPAGFAKFKLLKKITKHKVDVELYRQIFEDDFYLSRVKLNRWIQNAIGQALMSGPFQQIHEVTWNIPPATTMKINLANDVQVSVDLVPVIQMRHIPRSARKAIFKLPIQSRISCLAPQSPLKNAPESHLLLRISLPELEQELSEIGGHFKPLICLFKSIRDQNGWKNTFPSYLIKTFFMWQAELLPDNYWINQPIDQLFLESCMSFTKVLASGKVPNYVFPNLNQLACVQPVIIDKIVRKFTDIVNNPLGELQ